MVHTKKSTNLQIALLKLIHSIYSSDILGVMYAFLKGMRIRLNILHILLNLCFYNTLSSNGIVLLLFALGILIYIFNTNLVS